MRERTHVVLNQEAPYPPFITSPQVPGLMVAHATENSLIEHMDDDLRRFGVDGPYLVHTQFGGRASSGDRYQIRFINDERALERAAVAEQLLEQLEGPPTSLSRLGVDETGDYIFVIVLREDLLADVFEGSADCTAFNLVANDVHLGNLTVRSMGRELELDSMETVLADPEILTVGELLDSAPTIDLKSGSFLAGPAVPNASRPLEHFVPAAENGKVLLYA